MKEHRWGRSINISGTNTRTTGNLSGGARNISLVHFTRTLAVQLGRDGITILLDQLPSVDIECFTQAFGLSLGVLGYIATS